MKFTHLVGKTPTPLLRALVAGASMFLMLCPGALAGVTIYDADGKKIVVGGRVQVQY